ncbi:3-dehydroquinate synthase [Tissierella sp. MB52-C2]|uniref:3-dehydroquinate synthase n=1 Tax=Tissierella sp. MB52-C2 TaxID=3070999 RepID=UPI00280BA74F|nr:3-dehydroquinate synthase [Tissierella sp. MB52-C2]WMM23373.1 3-dehydroquinate synthase [Tissierella sp. MB52-C2]
MGYEIIDNIWMELKDYIIKNNFLLITDENIYNIYKENIEKLTNNKSDIYILEPGENSKRLEELSNIYKALINKNLDRDGIILSLGGGVVGDISGFAASTYKRGIDYIQIPTTLLSQIDSSIGGKTGVDFLGYKNIIGSFYFPSRTLIDPSFINTLNEREITCGLGEIIKYGLIEDYGFFRYIGENIKNIYSRDNNVLSYIIEKSVKIKSSIVEKDKLDLGLRQKLNFGHTVGHSIESLFRYERYNHGEAVILGIIYETKIAYEKKLISREYYNEIISILRPLVEPVSFSENEVNMLLKYMKNDKKNKNNKIGFVLPTDKGKVDIFYDIDEEIIKKVFKSN